MTPFDYARRIVPIDCPGKHVFVVSIANESWRIALAVTASAQQADEVALIARQIIAAEVVKALRDEDCRIAALTDAAYLDGRLHFPTEVSALCREQAELHTVGLHTGNGKKDPRTL